MLVLTRMASEIIIIRTPGVPDVEISVVSIKPKAVRIGVNADSETVIIRKEIDGKDSEKAA